MKCAKPHEWKSGAAIIVRSPALSGIRDRSEIAGLRPSGVLREAPFGVPVVPDVRITTRPGLGGRHGRLGVARLDQLLERGVGRRVVVDPAR